MATGSVTNPYGNNAQMVDRLIGTAYDVVKLVSENLAYIKHVSQNLANISEVANISAEILAVESKLAEITTVAADLTNIDNVSDNISAINALFNSLDELNAIYNNLTYLQSISSILPQILSAVSDAEAARDAAEGYAQDALENSAGVTFASNAEMLAGTNTTHVVTPANTKYAIDNLAASVAQGEKADTALQPGEAATPAQGAKADTALQSTSDLFANNGADYYRIHRYGTFPNDVVGLEKLNAAGEVESSLAMFKDGVSSNFPWTIYNGLYNSKVNLQNGGIPGIARALSVNFDVFATGTTAYDENVLRTSPDRGILFDSVVGSGPVGTVVTDGLTTYGPNWIAHPSINAANVLAGKIKIGMVIDTIPSSGAMKSGIIVSIDTTTGVNRAYIGTAGVSTLQWVKMDGNTTTTTYELPTAGTPARVNSITHLWGGNMVIIGGRVDASGNAADYDLHGYECDVQFERNMGVVLGWDLVARSKNGAIANFAAAFSARSDTYQWHYGLYSENNKQHTMWRMNQLMDLNPDTGLTNIPTFNRKEYSFQYGMNNEIYSRTALGIQSASRVKFAEKNISYAVDVNNDEQITFFGTGAYTCTLPPIGSVGIQNGRKIPITNIGSQAVNIRTAESATVIGGVPANGWAIWQYSITGGWIAVRKGSLA